MGRIWGGAKRLRSSAFDIKDNASSRGGNHFEAMDAWGTSGIGLPRDSTFRRTKVKIKSIVISATFSAALLGAGIYSQLVAQSPKTPSAPSNSNLPANTKPGVYSGDNLGYVVTYTNFKLDGYFAIKVDGKWGPIPSKDEPSVKKLQATH
jgi:hypothetical protein